MTGILIQLDDRPDIIFDNGTFYGGLHCGDCFNVQMNQWINVRLEYSDEWVVYYRGKRYPVPFGKRVEV